MTLDLRRLVTQADDIRAEGGTRLARPACRVWAAAVVGNPLAAETMGALDPLVAAGAELGEVLGRAALELLGPAPSALAYGKAAIVGTAGRIEHGAAVLHPRLGRPLRAVIGGGKAIIPSTVKTGGGDARIDVPLHGVNDEWDFSLLDAVTVGIPGAPAPDEIVTIVVLAQGGRPLARLPA